MSKKKYRWFICFGCLLMIFCTGGLAITGFIVYQPYLIRDGGLSNTQSSAVLLIRNLFTMLAMFAVVPVLRNTGLRLGASLGVLGTAAAFTIFGLARSFPVFCLAAALAGFSYGIGGMVASSVMISQWFDDHAGLALGICTSGTGISAIIGTPVINRLIETYSMKQAFMLEAGFTALLSVAVFLILRNCPESDDGTMVHSPAVPSENQKYKVSHLQTILIICSVFLIGGSYNSSSHLSVLYRSSGFDASSISGLLSLMGIFICVGKCIYGLTVDRLGSYSAGILCNGCLVTGIALSCFCGTGSLFLARVSVVFLGLGYPMLSVGLSVLADAVARPFSYAAVVKQFQIYYMVGTMLFGILPGMIADQTGSYIPAYIMLAVIALISTFLSQSVLRHADSV